MDSFYLLLTISRFSW